MLELIPLALASAEAVASVATALSRVLVLMSSRYLSRHMTEWRSCCSAAACAFSSSRCARTSSPAAFSACAREMCSELFAFSSSNFTSCSIASRAISSCCAISCSRASASCSSLISRRCRHARAVADPGRVRALALSRRSSSDTRARSASHSRSAFSSSTCILPAESAFTLCFHRAASARAACACPSTTLTRSDATRDSRWASLRATRNFCAVAASAALSSACSSYCSRHASAIPRACEATS
mmetsp:Transcript_13930/g.36130  ORF Transcript_13930/g.36130 Transcript_13930/m.36130 type:complete len:242 (+) Transcript_13930:495-1220(+)